MRLVKTVPIPANSTNNTLVFSLNNFGLLLRDVNPKSFLAEKNENLTYGMHAAHGYCVKLLNHSLTNIQNNVRQTNI